jgi:hypothetical protein
MAAQIDNTPAPTQKGATNRLTNQPINQSSHGAGNNPRNSRPITDITKINRHKIEHSASFVPLTEERGKVIVFLVDTPVELEKGFSPSESATSQKLSRYTFDMVRERKKWALVALRVRQLNVTYHPGSRSEAVSRVTSHESRVTNYLDTRVEIKIESTLAESTTSPKTSRYTFDMLGNAKKGG